MLFPKGDTSTIIAKPTVGLALRPHRISLPGDSLFAKIRLAARRSDSSSVITYTYPPEGPEIRFLFFPLHATNDRDMAG